MKSYKVVITQSQQTKLQTYKQAGFETCLLPISIKNRFQQAEKLVAILDWAHLHFKFVMADLGDTLDRHNIEGSSDIALHKSRVAGDVWVRDNSQFLGDTHLIRWDEYLNSSKFLEAITQEKELYDNDADLQRMVNEDIEYFRKRRPDLNWSKCRDYLLEERAVEEMRAAGNPTVLVYPGRPLKTYEGLTNVRQLQYRVLS